MFKKIKNIFLFMLPLFIATSSNLISMEQGHVPDQYAMRDSATCFRQLGSYIQRADIKSQLQEHPGLENLKQDDFFEVDGVVSDKRLFASRVVVDSGTGRYGQAFFRFSLRDTVPYYEGCKTITSGKLDDMVLPHEEINTQKTGCSIIKGFEFDRPASFPKNIFSPPSVELTFFSGPNHLPGPKPPVEQDPRFRDIERDKPKLEYYSRDQIDFYLKGQWEQIHAYENHVKAIRESGVKYQNFDEFALDQFNLYQCKNFLEYFKTLPGYEQGIKQLIERYGTDPKFRDDLDRFDDIDDFKNEREYWWALGLIGSTHDKRAFKDFIFSEYAKIKQKNPVGNSNTKIETDQPEIVQDVVRTDLQLQQEELDKQEILKQMAGSVAEFGQNIDSSVNDFQTMLGTFGVGLNNGTDTSGSVKGSGGKTYAIPGSRTSIEAGTRENYGPGKIGFSDQEQEALEKQEILKQMTSSVDKFGEDIDSSVAKLKDMVENPPAPDPTVRDLKRTKEPGPPKKKAKTVSERAADVGKAALVGGLHNATQFAASRGIDAAFDAWRGKDQYSGPVQSRFTSFLSQQDTRPFQFQPPFQQQSQQPPIFMDGNVPGPPIQPGGPTTTTTTGNIAPEDVGMEGTIVTGRDGVRYDLDKLKRLIDHDKKINDRVRAQIEGNPEQQHAGIICNMVDGMSEMVESILDRHRQRASLTDEQEMLEFALIMQKTERYIVRGAERLAKGLAGSAKDWDPLFINNIKSVIHFLENAPKPGEFPYYWAGDSRVHDAAVEQWRQRSVDQQKRFDECVDRIKQMSWGDLVEGGAHLGGDFLLNGASLCILKKLPSAGGRFVSGLKKFAEAGRAEETVAAANKGLSIANQVSMDTAIGVKLATEYGTDGAAKILKIIEQHPEILRQEGKTIIEVVQEVAEQSHLRPNPGYRPPSPNASTLVGRKGWDLKGLDGKNKSTIIYGREYSGHAIDRIQQRGLTPMAIENSIKIGRISPDPKPGRLRHYDFANNITVITCQKTGNVISVFFGER